MAAGDRAGLERLVRYAGRPALSHQRVSITAAGQVCYRLHKPYYTGQTQVVFEPIAFLERLAALVPPKRQNQIRYYGLLAAQAHDRLRLLALGPAATDDAHVSAAGGPDRHDGAHTADATADPGASPPIGPAFRIRWAKLLARVFQLDVLRCGHCGQRRQVIAAITDSDVAVGILAHLALPTEAPRLAPARAPPQTQMFGAQRDRHIRCPRGFRARGRARPKDRGLRTGAATPYFGGNGA